MHVMRHIRDVYLQQPAAVLAAFDIYGIIEIPRRFAVDGDNGQLAEIFAPGALGFADRLREALRLGYHFAREDVGQMMFANDDLGVDTEIARPPEQFHNAANGRGAATPV